MEIKTDIFDKPSAGIRGIITAFVKLGKKDHRVGHAYLLVDKPTQLTLDVPKSKITPDQAKDLSDAIRAFAAAAATA